MENLQDTIKQVKNLITQIKLHEYGHKWDVDYFSAYLLICLSNSLIQKMCRNRTSRVIGLDWIKCIVIARVQVQRQRHNSFYVGRSHLPGKSRWLLWSAGCYQHYLIPYVAGIKYYRL